MEPTNCIFTPDQTTDRPVIRIPGERIASPAAVLDIDVSDEVCLRGDRFADEIRDRFLPILRRQQRQSRRDMRIHRIVWFTYQPFCISAVLLI